MFFFFSFLIFFFFKHWLSKFYILNIAISKNKSLKNFWILYHFTKINYFVFLNLFRQKQIHNLLIMMPIPYILFKITSKFLFIVNIHFWLLSTYLNILLIHLLIIHINSKLYITKIYHYYNLPILVFIIYFATYCNKLLENIFDFNNFTKI